MNQAPHFYSPFSPGPPRAGTCIQPLPARHEVRTALVIGDLGLQLHSLQGWLARHGLAVLRAGAPERALAMLLDRAFPIDLMIVDAIAPSAISLDLTADLARLRPGFPVLYIFGQQPSVLRSSLELQAPQCVLSAPFRETDLVTRIDVLLAQPAAGARLVSAA